MLDAYIKTIEPKVKTMEMVSALLILACSVLQVTIKKTRHKPLEQLVLIPLATASRTLLQSLILIETKGKARESN